MHFLLLGCAVGPVVYVAALILVGGIDAREWRMLRQVGGWENSLPLPAMPIKLT